MSNFTLKDRIISYQGVSDYKLISRLPIIITINGKNFSKNTELLDKPYCAKFAECMFSTTLKMCHEIEGAIFAYQFNDEIVVVARNDQNVDTIPWYNNKIQKICSDTAAVATLHFNNCASTIDLNINEPIFTSEVFAVPNIPEAINVMIYKQQQSFYSAIQLASFYELLKKYDKNTIKEMLTGLTVDEKIDLLHQECNIDFNNYPASFRRGAACYKIPKVIDNVMKNKWVINKELSIFTRDQSFLTNIFRMGTDIFRQENL